MAISAGNGTRGHVGAELFKLMTGTQIVHVPYKGGLQGMTDLIAGQVHIMFDSMSSITPQYRAGRLRALAVSGAKRSASFPELPTIAEAGVPGYGVSVWSGVIALAGLSKPVLARLNAAVNQAVASPGLQAKYAVIGAEPVTGTPAQFAELIRKEAVRRADVVKRSGAKID